MPRHFSFTHFTFPNAPLPPPTGSFLDLNEAIIAYHASQPALVAAVRDGKCWHEEAPQGTKLPYCTFLVPSEVIEERTTGPIIEKVRAAVQFNLHHWTQKQSKDLGRLWKSAYRMAALEVEGVPVMHCLYTGRQSEIGESLGDGGKDCIIEIVTFDVLYTRSV